MVGSMTDDQPSNTRPAKLAASASPGAPAEPGAATRPRSPRRPSVGTTIGGVLAGVDGQIFRTTPPAAELVQRARPVRGLSGEDGTLLSIELPEDDDPDPPR